MYYHENLRKAREYLFKRQKQMEVQKSKPMIHQAATIRQIYAIIRQKEKSESETKLPKAIPTMSSFRKDDTCIPLMVIQSSNPEYRESKHSISGKLLRLNKITQHKTEMTPTQYNFIDRIVEATATKQNTRSEESSPVRIRKNIPGNLTERKYCIQQIREQQRVYHIKNPKTEACIPISQIRSGSNSPAPKKLNQTSYVGDKKLNQQKNQPQEIQFKRQMSGWTVKSQESVHTLI